MVAATDLVKVTPVDADGEGKGVEVYVTAGELATGGSGFTQVAFQPAAAGANPTKAEYDALLAALIAAGIMAAS
jgi:hypothetical protein